MFLLVPSVSDSLKSKVNIPEFLKSTSHVYLIQLLLTPGTGSVFVNFSSYTRGKLLLFQHIAKCQTAWRKSIDHRSDSFTLFCKQLEHNSFSSHCCLTVIFEHLKQNLCPAIPFCHCEGIIINACMSFDLLVCAGINYVSFSFCLSLLACCYSNQLPILSWCREIKD